MRIRIAVVTTVVVVGLWVPSLAHALCAQIYVDGDADPYFGEVWGETDIWFEASNEIEPGISCGLAMYYLGGSAEYTAETQVQGPYVPASNWGGPSQWSAHAAAQLSIQQGGFGEYHVIGSGEEDLCLDGCGCIYSDYIHGDVLVSVPYPDIEIFASDYAPYLNSGPVQVWAELDPFWASPEPIAWGGCEPDGSNAICWFEPAALGPHTVSAWYPGGGFDEVVITVQQPPPPALELKLYLDALPYDSQQPVDDDLEDYMPGSYLANGVSRAVQPEGTPLDTVRVIAAFVDASGQIVPPPVNQVTFSLDDTSAFKGYAMNAGTSEDPDFAFASGQQQVTAGFSGNLSWANVNVFDYGGSTTARVEATGFPPVEIRIPLDNNNNWIADAGWRAYGHQSHPAQQADDCTSTDCQWEDADAMPTGSGPPGYGIAGDGLTTWEEYRGFIVRGTHVRTHPGHKDLFVASVVTDTNLNAFNALEYATENLRRNNATMDEIGVRLHHVWGEDDTNIPQGQFREYSLDQGEPNPLLPVQRRINFNEPVDRGLTPQRAVRMRMEALPMGTVGEWRGECWPVNQPNPQGVFPGGGVPYSTVEIVVHVQQLQSNHHELKRTIGHEIGHAINVVHRTGGPRDCIDGVTISGATSVMSAVTGASGNVSSPDAQFDADDVPQIRIRWDDVPP